MRNSDVLGTLTGEPRQFASGTATDDSLATIEEPMEQQWNAWQDVIDYELVEWGRQPAKLDDGLIIPPTPSAVSAASRLARTLRDKKFVPPKRVVPDGDGGIVFDHWSGTTSASFEISSVGAIELVVLRNHRVVTRRSV